MRSRPVTRASYSVGEQLSFIVNPRLNLSRVLRPRSANDVCEELAAWIRAFGGASGSDDRIEALARASPSGRPQ